MNEQEKPLGKESLERLQKRLYRQGEEFGERKTRPELYTRAGRVTEEWPTIQEEEKQETQRPSPRRKISPLTLFLVISGVTALAVVGFTAWYIIYGGAGSISVKDIVIKIDAPTEAAGGDLVRWEVNVINGTNRELEIADLIFYYPADSRPVHEEDRTTLRKRIALGKIPAHERVTHIFEAFIFGEEKSRAEARAILEYRVSGSNVILANESAAELFITKAPLTVSVKAPSDINSGDDITLEVEIISQAKDILDEAILEMTYPDGFSFRSAEPVASLGDNRWVLGNIKPNEKRRILIRGLLSAPDLEDRHFRAEVGKLQDNRIAVLYGGNIMTVTLERPFLDFSFVKGETGDVLKTRAFGGIEIKWKNNLPVAVQNAILRVRIEGKGLEEESLLVDRGFYRGTDKTLIWNASSYPAFAFVEPGEEGSVRFQFRVPSSFPMQSPADAHVTLTLQGTFEALQRPPGYEDIDISTTRDYELKIATDLQLVRKGLYHFDPLPGFGPLPPKVGQETVYTISWTLINTTNEVKNLKVESVLPAYMVWKGVIVPSDGGLVYDQISGKITWNVGSLSAGTGIIHPSKEIYFQVGFTPVPADVGRIPIIVGEAIVTAEDGFTGIALRDSEPAQTLDLSDTDPNFRRGQGVITQ